MHFFLEFRRAFDTWHKIQNVVFSKNGSFENESDVHKTSPAHLKTLSSKYIYTILTPYGSASLRQRGNTKLENGKQKQWPTSKNTNDSITPLHSSSSLPIVGTKLTLETMPQALAVGGHAL